MKMFIRALIMVSLGAASERASAQDIFIYGTILKYEMKAPLPEARIVLKLDSGQAATFVADSAGRYSFTVDLGRVAEVEYRYPGRVSKHVSIDGRGVPASEVAGGFGMHIDIRLCKPVDGPGLDFLNEPIGRAAYSPETRNVAWDMEYTAPRVARYKALFPDLYPAERDSITWLDRN